MARQTVVLYTSDMEAAIKEVNGTTQAAVTVRLSNVAFVASMRQTFNLSSLKNSSPTPPNQDLDQVSSLMLNAWQEAQNKGLLKEPSKRVINMARRGVAAVALVMESDISTAVLPYMLAGAHLLADSYATASASNLLTIIFEPFFVTSTDIPGGSVLGIPPQVGAPAPTMVPSAFISSWPSVITFNQRLYCFYRGLNTKARQLFYNEFNGSSWTGEKSLPNTNTFAGPSAVVFGDAIYCFQQGEQNRNEIWYSTFDGSQWKDRIQVPNTRITAGPCAVTFNKKIYLIHQGFTRPDNALWYNVFDGITWEGDKNVAGSLITESPSAVLFNNLIYCFHQGAGATANVLMVNTLNPTTGAWSGSKPVPNSQRMSQGPSAVVVKDKLYCFHQDVSGGKLYANVTGNGVEWGEDTLIEDVNLCEGLAATSYNEELLYFFQKGQSGQVKDGEMWYRKLILSAQTGDVGAGEGSQGEPPLGELNYEDGYKGFIQLAKDMSFKYQADYGYVVYVTQSGLLFPAYADDVRMCLEYSEPSSLHVAFSKMFSAQGTFDQGLVNNSPDYPSIVVSQNEPRYTLAWVLDWNYVFANATIILFYRARDYSNNPYLWLLFLDRRNNRWIEMQGPKMSPRVDQVLNGAPTPQFGPGSKLYVFYHTDTNTQMRYNCLGITNQMGEAVWGVEMVMHDARAYNSPSPISVDQYMHVFHMGTGEEFRYTTLDTRPNEWLEDKLAYTVWSSSSVSAVHYLDKIYVFHKGIRWGNDARIAYSIWDKETLEWKQGGVAASSTNVVEGEPTAVVHKDLVYVFYTNGGNAWLNVFNGVAWTGATQVGMAYKGSRLMNGSISACVWGDNIHCFFRARGTTDRQFVYHKVYNVNDSTWNDEVILPTASGFYSKAGAILNTLLVGS